MRTYKSLLVLIFVCFMSFLRASAQDTIMLINGKRIHANVLEIQDNSIKYRIGGSDQKVKSINPYRVFTVIKADGAEQVIFQPDTMMEGEFTIPQLRMFVKGEAAAQEGYHNNLNKAAAFVVGAGSSFFSIYGVIGPAIYTSIVGSVSPDLAKQPTADPALVPDEDYREGYLKVARNKKIKNSYISGMLGFAVGFATQAIIGKNSK